jgi:hypothetical protein
MACLALAIWDQVVRAPEHRTWHGDVFGIPYDFRTPTRQRIRATLWSADSDRVLAPHIFGVGWTPNVGRLYALVRRRLNAA